MQRKMRNTTTMQEQIELSGLEIMSSLSLSSSLLQWNSTNQWSPLLGGGRAYQACVTIMSGNCEVVVGTTSNCLPTSIPILPILLSAILYALQYLYLFPPIVRLFYLMRCLHPYLILLSIQPGILFTYDHPNPSEYKIKFFVVNSIS